MASSTPNTAELPILEACLDLIRWYVPLLQCLPRQHRFGLGDRLVSALYDLVEALVAARYARVKLPILEPLGASINLLQTRLLHDFHLIDLPRYEHGSRLIAAIGRQHSGWLSHQRQAL
jgi:hypothetical protein